MDKKAKSILFKTYWTAKGWKRDYETDPADFEYAKSKGLMFDPISISIEDVQNELRQVLQRIEPEKITNGFLASLGNKRLDWRSALASYANAQLILEGKRPATRPSGYIYEQADLNVLNFERIKWAGVRHSDLLYNYLDLQLFEKEQITSPTKEDITTFKGILTCIARSEAGDYPSKLRDRLKEVMKASKDQRHTLMEILSCCEILLPGSYDRPISGRHDWDFVAFWRGEDKYNKAAVTKYFGNVLT